MPGPYMYCSYYSMWWCCLEAKAGEESRALVVRYRCVPLVLDFSIFGGASVFAANENKQ